MSRGQLQQDREDASRKAAKNLLMKLGARLEQLDRWVAETPDDAHYITEVRFKVRYGTVGDVLAMVKATGPAGKEIAFHSDDTITEALSGLVSRLANGSLKWREDKPYVEVSDK